MSIESKEKPKLDYGYGYNETNSVIIIWEAEDVRLVIKQNDLPLELDDDQSCVPSFVPCGTISISL